MGSPNFTYGNYDKTELRNTTSRNDQKSLKKTNTINNAITNYNRNNSYMG